MWVFLSDSVDNEETCFGWRNRIQSGENTSTFQKEVIFTANLEKFKQNLNAFWASLRVLRAL